ncbi:hypothetical protein LTR05_001211 [Lithohypha guttulata]|uniref:Uncharacterized protein n=1 Tax=Lithohypha guttulata TaxID=1690604 RepID=A0AAN7TEH4_9EURO|nr:hypothetical protein LTR05_001211 [Lithohypha guttulata]
MEPIPPIDPRLHLPADMFYGNFVCFVQQEGQMLDTISNGILHDYDGKPTSDAQVFLDDIRANHGMTIPIDERKLTDKQRRMATMHGTNPSSKMRRRETIVGLRKNSRGQLRWHVRLLSISEGPMTSLQTLQPFDPARYQGSRSVARNHSRSQISPGTRAGPTRHSLVAPRPASLVNADGAVVGRGSREVVGQAALSQAVDDLVASEAPESNTQTRGRKRRRIQQD